MAKEKFKANKIGEREFWKVFCYYSEEIVGGNYSQDMLKDPIYKKSSFTGPVVSLCVGERIRSQNLLHVLVKIWR